VTNSTSNPTPPTRRRSRDWFESPEIYGWLRTAALRGLGLTPAASDDRPIIGICNTWSELTHCNAHLRHVADAVRRGVLQAGGLPLEFPVLSTGEFNMRPTAMLYRNLASMDVEEAIRANPLDAVVLLGGCDKTTPALLMGAASADVPAILVTGGPQLNAHWRGESIGSCTDCRRYQSELRAGRTTEANWADLQGHMIRSPGHCMTMGTASTMACLAEALGMAPPGNGAIPAADSRRLQLAESAGRYAVELANRDVRPSHILTPRAFDNAIRILHAIGGSTNAVIHLIAIAGRLGLDLRLERFDILSRSTPLLVDLKPTGRFLMEDFCYAGGVPALMAELGPLLDMVAPTVTGHTLGENWAGARVWNSDVIRPKDRPVHAEGGLAVLRGSLAPGGAMIKPAAATPALLTHRGRAVVFEDHDDLIRRIDDPNLDVRAEDVLVLRQAGPVGGPGMPEWGFLPIPKKLLAAGVRDMVRISDARMSGTAFGTVVVHVSPESAVGGPLAAVQNGDLIELDVPNRRLELLIEPQEIARRLAAVRPSGAQPPRGYQWLYARHVLQAEAGCDFDFLRAVGSL
jgi:L-arabonate dehydrase